MTDINDKKTEVLIVDDMPESLKLLERVLEKGSIAVRSATSGQAALQMTQASLPDLILLDIVMPVMDGFKTCRRLKADPKTQPVPIIFLTGRGETEKVIQGFELGAVDYINKPFNPTELLHRVGIHVELYRLQQNLSHQIEEKTDEAQHAQDHVEKTNQVYSSFIPQQFLNLLQRDNILDVKLGDQVQVEMNILSANIISFTTLSEKLGPEESFSFINAYLSWVSPIIRMQKGFIDNYIGDAIMALFPEEADDPVKAAIGMQKAMTQFNEKFVAPDIPKVQIGFGIHLGPLMLGIIGDAERMETTVISNAVNIAFRLERLTRYYQAELIVSEHVMKRLKNRNQYKFRVLDKVQINGHHGPLVIYEIFDGNSAEDIERKLSTQQDYEQALQLYYNRKFTQANLLIAQALTQDPDDQVLHIHQERIAAAIVHGVPDDWTGVESDRRRFIVRR